MKKKSGIQRFILFTAIAVCCANNKKLTIPAAPAETKNFDACVFDWSRTWAEVMQLVKEKHYKVQDPQKGMVKGLNEFLNHLDPHSAFLDPETYTKMVESTSGEFYGVGI